MTQPNEPSPIPAPILALRSLFESELREVSFPDVNRAVLEEAAQRVEAAAAEVAAREEALLTARRALAEGQDALLLKAQRALAYARIFAEENPELLTRLDSVTLPRAARKAAARADGAAAQTVAADEPAVDAAPRKRGRPARTRPAGMLFAEDGTAQEGAVADA